MAKVFGSLKRIHVKYPDIDLNKIKLIGWGAGKVFRDYFPYVPLPISYTVCPILENQGKFIHGIEAKNPSAILSEDPKEILIVIYAAEFAEIMHQIRDGLGDYRSMAAIERGDADPAINDIISLSSMYQHIALKRPTPNKPKIGIFNQGPIFELTPLVLAHQRLHYPDAYSCLVTWNGQAEEKIVECARWVDKVIILDPPKFVWDPRNFIIRSCKAGARHLADIGAEYSVRCRSDFIMMGFIHTAIENMFDTANGNNRKMGIYAQTGWRHVPFHFTDKFHIGRTADMQALWSVAEDTRSASDFAALFDGKSVSSLGNAIFESYIWMNYAKQLGYPTKNLEDGYHFAAKELFFFDKIIRMISLKHLPLYNLKFNAESVAGPDWWNKLLANEQNYKNYAKEMSLMNFSIGDMFGGRVG